MKIFLHELAVRWKSQTGWVVALILFMLLSIVKFDALSTDKAASEALLSQLPATMQAVFGMTGLDLATLSGYFGILFVYILLMLSIHAGMLGAGVLSDEEQDRTTEFLFVKPRTRAFIVTQKLLAGLVCLVLMWLVVMVSTRVSVIHIANNSSFLQDFWPFMIALAVVQLTMYFVGAFVAALMSNPRWPTRLVAIIVFITYLIFAFIKLVPNLTALKYFSLFCYFDAVDIITLHGVRAGYVVVCSILILLSIFGTYFFYSRRDLKV